MRELIQKLKNDPSIDKIYFNVEGGYLFDKKNNHPIVKSREEILALEDGLPAEHVTNDDVSSLLEENRLLKEENELLKLEKTILEEDKVSHQTKIDELNTQLEKVSQKTVKIKNNAIT